MMPKLQPVPIFTKHQSLLVRWYRWLFKPRKWQLIEDWTYHLNDGTILLVPKGFIFDGASIPRPLWWLLSPTGLLLIPSLIHDFAYRYQYLYKATSNITYQICFANQSRSFYDQLFLQISIETNGITYIENIVLFFMKLFSGFSWRKRRKQQKDIPEIIPTTYFYSRRTN